MYVCVENNLKQWKKGMCIYIYFMLKPEFTFWSSLHMNEKMLCLLTSRKMLLHLCQDLEV